MKYMGGEIEDIEEIGSMRQVKELFAQMRNLYRKLEYEQKNLLANNPGGGQEAPDRQKSVHDNAKSKN